MNEKFKLPNNVADAMRDNLPAQVSKILREELNKGAEAIVSVDRLDDAVARLRRELEGHKSLRSIKANLDERSTDLDSREAELAVLHETQSSRDSNVNLVAERRISAAFESALAGLVRNTEWRETVHNYHVDCDTVSGKYGTNTATKSTPSDTTRKAT